MAKVSSGICIDRPILTLRNSKVVLDSDLAAIYRVTTKRLNEQVSRNKAKFRADFAFQLTQAEWDDLRSQIATSSSGHGGRRSLPYVFTEHGALQAANVLNSPRATAMSIYVIRAFVKLREHLAANEAILRRLAEIDQTLLTHDAALRDIYQKLLPLLSPAPDPPKPQIGFHMKEGTIPYRITRKTRPRNSPSTP